MSQHPSLRAKEKSAKFRSVLKRYERLKALFEKGKWDEDNSVFGLPKLKVLRYKVRKEKAASATSGATQEQSAALEGVASKGEQEPKQQADQKISRESSS